MHEAQMHSENCFVTLTYDNDHLVGPSLEYRDFQLFMKRVRKEIFPRRVRFFMAGEYGERNFRPHFHCLFFGFRFPESEFITRSRSGGPPGPHRIWRSDLLDSLWGLGFSSVGELTFESAAYVARYVMKKRTGPMAGDAYKRVDLTTGEVVDVRPEFCRMSLKPGIGASWFERYQAEVFPHDRVIVRGKEAKPPRYYLQLLERQDPAAREAVRLNRRVAAWGAAAEQTKPRLAAREAVAAARCRSLRRKV